MTIPRKKSTSAQKSPRVPVRSQTNVTATPHSDLHMVYGIHPVTELLRAKKRHIRFVYTLDPEPAAVRPLLAQFSTRVTIQRVSRERLHALAGSEDHQGIVAYATAFEFRKKPFDPKQHPFIVLLDSIQDARNMGAIIRSAYCTNADGVIVCEKRGAPLNAAAIKASAGLAEHMVIQHAPSPEYAVKELRDAGYNIYLAALGGDSITDATFTSPLCIVIGNEGTGITPSLLTKGTRIMLPQRTSDISYNASVAAGICLFTIGLRLGRLS